MLVAEQLAFKVMFRRELLKVMAVPEVHLFLVAAVLVALMAVRLVVRLPLDMAVAVAVLEQTALILLWLVVPVAVIQKN
jgi:hypothetical protein